MKRILFLIHDLGQGGAEKVLVNLVNHMNPEKFDITVLSLFDVGVNRQFLAEHIHYKYCFRRMIRGNTQLMKCLSPRQLHQWLIKDRYDIEISFLEGPCARIISGCPHKETKLLTWIHCTMQSQKMLSASFRSRKEALHCYNRMDTMVFVSRSVLQAFTKFCPTQNNIVLYNTNQSDLILSKVQEPLPTPFPAAKFHWCGIGKLEENKGFDRMLRIHKRLLEDGYDIHYHILGIGSLETDLKAWCQEQGLCNHVSFEGYQTNPYAFLRHCDFYVCASHSEGFSTAATEALIVGTPVCTVEVSGMKEMLGENNEYGIVTKNDENALYEGIKTLLDDPALLQHYAEQAALRGKDFSTEETVRAVEDMLLSI